MWNPSWTLHEPWITWFEPNLKGDAAHMLLVFKMPFEMLKNLEQKISRVHLDILCAHKVVSRKTDNFAVKCKKDKFRC